MNLVFSYSHVFTYKHDPKAGVTFLCDAGGNLSPDLSPEEVARFRKCRYNKKFARSLNYLGVIGRPVSRKS